MGAPLLVSCEWLASHSSDPELRVADVRWSLVEKDKGRTAYREAHVPGAVFIDLDTDLAAPRGQGPGRHPLPTPESFAAAMSRAGIGPRTHTWWRTISATDRPRRACGGCFATSVTRTYRCSTAASRGGSPRTARSRRARAGDAGGVRCRASPGDGRGRGRRRAAARGSGRPAARRAHGGNATKAGVSRSIPSRVTFPARATVPIPPTRGPRTTRAFAPRTSCASRSRSWARAGRAPRVLLRQRGRTPARPSSRSSSQVSGTRCCTRARGATGAACPRGRWPPAPSLDHDELDGWSTMLCPTASRPMRVTVA